MSSQPTGDHGAVDLASAIAAVRDIVHERITEAEAASIDGDTRLEDLALDSLDLAELFTSLEERSGILLDANSVERLGTVADLMHLKPAPGSMRETAS